MALNRLVYEKNNYQFRDKQRYSLVEFRARLNIIENVIENG